MTQDKPKAAGYIRVSSKEQTEGESLDTQRQSIKDFCKQQGYQLTEIYADEGISGGNVKDRHALLRCLHDGQKGKFDTLVIHRLSRFGRNARELLNNNEELQNADIKLRSISEGIDFGNKYGKAMLGMFAVMAELERDIIREQMLENRIARGKKGIPTSGRVPIGRTFNRETGQWELDENVAKALQWAASEYLKGHSFLDIAETLKTRHNLNISHRYLITILKERCGDTWNVKFDAEDEPITYKIPRILDEETIKSIKERLAHNQVETRKDVKKYVLNGFIRCEKCHRTLSGQTQKNRHGNRFLYYRHPTGRQVKCKAFSSVPLRQIEKAVFQTIFENIADIPSFEKAIQDSLPDEQYIKDLQSKVNDREKELKKLSRQLDELVNLALSGALEHDTIKSREQALKQEKAKLESELDGHRQKLKEMPDITQVKQEADDIRRELLDKYSGPEHLAEMTFDEKKELLHWLFSGKDDEGVPYGIYVNKDKGIRGKIDYFMYGRITGLRTVKGDDIDYFDEEGSGEPDKNSGSGANKEKGGRNKLYKTRNSTFNNNHGLP